MVHQAFECPSGAFTYTLHSSVTVFPLPLAMKPRTATRFSIKSVITKELDSV